MTNDEELDGKGLDRESLALLSDLLHDGMGDMVSPQLTDAATTSEKYGGRIIVRLVDCLIS